MKQQSSSALVNNTIWENPTDVVVTFAIMMDGVSHDIYVQPGNTVTLSSVYDQAIRTERDGQIVAGLAPQLIPKGREAIPLADALFQAAKLGDQERALLLKGIVPTKDHINGMADLVQQVHNLKVAPQNAMAERDAEIARLRAELEKERARANSDIDQLRAEFEAFRVEQKRTAPAEPTPPPAPATRGGARGGAKAQQSDTPTEA